MPKTLPKNLTAQLSYRARGNPPSTLPSSAISNCFPGLEYDFRNVWKNLFVGIELHEFGGNSEHLVVGVEAGSTAEAAGVRPNDGLRAVDDVPVSGPIVTQEGPLNRTRPLELSNALADILGKAGSGETVKCTFRRSTTGAEVEVDLALRPLFDQATLAEELAEPGAMTQSLCSPWQADYRECGCYYWAASRPDYINVEVDDQGRAQGHNWMQRDRSPGAEYAPDDPQDTARQFSYDDLYRRWEEVLRFVQGGRDEE